MSRFAALALAALLSLGTALPADCEQPGASPAGPTVEIFVRDGCSYCREAEQFLRELQAESPGLRVGERVIVGFSGAEGTGSELRALLDPCTSTAGAGWPSMPGRSCW